MSNKKHITPGEKTGLKLTAAERALVLDSMCLDEEFEEAIRDTPPGEPIRLDLDEWDLFGGFIAAEANHTEDKNLQKKLDAIFQKIETVLDTYTDEEPAHLRRVFPGTETGFSEDTAITEPILALAAEFQAARDAASGRAEKAAVKLTKPQRGVLVAHTRVKSTLKEQFNVPSKGERTHHLGLADLMELGFALSEGMKSSEGRDQRILLNVAQKVADGMRALLSELKTAKQPKEGSRKPKASKATVFQLKITLNGIKPPIWRRVQTRDCTLARLHDIIQLAMGWQFSHLHAFEIGGEHYSTHPDMECEPATGVKLSQLVEEGVGRFGYVYDMGDNWEHVIKIEKTLPAESGVCYPRCITGKRACPPEDCGGIWGYEEFVGRILDPHHEEHEDMLEWVGGDFDPERFDLQQVNELLKEVRQ